MGVNSLPKTVTRQRRGCDLNPGPTAPESSTLTTRLPSHSIASGQPIWILLKQETVSGSGISWAVCKSAPRSRQTTTPASTPPLSFFCRPEALRAAQPTASEH